MKPGKIGKAVSSAIASIVFILCLAYMARYFQWHSIAESLSQVDLKWLVGAGSATIICFWLMRTLRWLIMLKAIGVHTDFFRLYRIMAISMALTIITPLQSGEALKVELLKRSGAMERSPGYAVFLAERVLDLMAVVMIAAFSILSGISGIMDARTILPGSALLLAGFIGFLWVIRLIPADNPPGRFLAPFKECMMDGKTLLAAALLTLGGWLVVALGWYVSLTSISLPVSYFESIALMSIITVVNILSLVPGALGISEVGITAFLVHLHKSLPAAQSGAVILRAYGLLAITLGLIHYLGILAFSQAGRDPDRGVRES